MSKFHISAMANLRNDATAWVVNNKRIVISEHGRRVLMKLGPSLYDEGYLVRGPEVRTARKLEENGLAELSFNTARKRWFATLTPLGECIAKASGWWAMTNANIARRRTRFA